MAFDGSFAVKFITRYTEDRVLFRDFLVEKLPSMILLSLFRAVTYLTIREIASMASMKLLAHNKKLAMVNSSLKTNSRVVIQYT